MDTSAAQKIREIYQGYLDQALESLFRNHDQNGFWDGRDGRIIKRLVRSPEGAWAADKSFDLRYGPFGLMGVLYRRYRQPGDKRFDDKIYRHLDYLLHHVDDKAVTDTGAYAGTNYGILSSLALGYLIFGREELLDKAERIFRFNQRKYPPVRANILSLIMWGESWLAEALQKQGGQEPLLDEVKNHIHLVCHWFLGCQDKNGYFKTGDLRSVQFARTMYALWGLSRAVRVLGMKEWLPSVEKALDYHLSTQRTQDGAFLWHPKFYFTSIWPFLFYLPVYFPHGADWLFECHPTFFVNAAEQYRLAGGTKDYLDDEINAVSWIFGANRLNKDLVADSGIGVPIRVMDLSGRTFIPKENFKGTYEIGSYVMALTNLIERLNQVK